MVTCSVSNCSNRSDRDKQFSFYRFPSVKSNCSSPIKKLQEERRHVWIQRINRKDFTSAKAVYARICSNHFISGKPCNLKDKNNPDWAPSLNLGHQRIKNVDSTAATYKKFPQYSRQRNAWIKPKGSSNWQPSKASVICSKHFKKKYFITNYPCVRLVKNAIPTLFITHNNSCHEPYKVNAAVQTSTQSASTTANIERNITSKDLPGDNQKPEKDESISKESRASKRVDNEYTIKYLDKLKKRIQDQPEVFKKFIQILEDYRRNYHENGQIPVEADIFNKVSTVLKGHDDLIEEFKPFVPHATSSKLSKLSSSYSSTMGGSTNDESMEQDDQSDVEPLQEEERKDDIKSMQGEGEENDIEPLQQEKGGGIESLQGEKEDVLSDEDFSDIKECDLSSQEKTSENNPETGVVKYVTCNANQRVPYVQTLIYKLPQNNFMPLSENFHLKGASTIGDNIHTPLKSKIVQTKSKIEKEELIKETNIHLKIRALEYKISQMNQRHLQDKKKIKTLLQSQRRNKKKIAALNEHIQTLKEQLSHKESPSANPSLLEELLEREKSQTTDNIMPKFQYSENVRYFVTTLHDISKDAYKFVRSNFGKALPHEKTLYKWKRNEIRDILNVNSEGYFNEDNGDVNSKRYINEDNEAVNNIEYINEDNGAEGPFLLWIQSLNDQETNMQTQIQPKLPSEN